MSASLPAPSHDTSRPPDSIQRLLRELERLRRERRWPTLREIEEATGLPRATLSSWLNKGRVPHWDRLVVLLRFYGVDAGSPGEERCKQLWRPAYTAHRSRCYRRALNPPQSGGIGAVPDRRTAAPTSGRQWAVVSAPVSPVHHEPAGGHRPLKYKYRGDRVEPYTALPPSPDGRWLAVRTPADPPGHKWMPAEDLVISPP
ncbi:helix-turn-helix domain-containing protein [Actinomadura luteofluorescens]|uniref:helix-turn-helix domain-containing protein n=1 Tax=Actinomadura luteofluorescens TaxID=46163 RepID=UPI003BB1D50C